VIINPKQIDVHHRLLRGSNSAKKPDIVHVPSFVWVGSRTSTRVIGATR
jgi:hypothetical protein